MQIDWFTFFAQIVNFLIVLYLLKRFLYTPIISIMAQREAQISARFQEADELAENARIESENINQARQELEKQRESMMNESVEAAAKRRNAMLDAARAEVDEMQSRWFSAVEEEKQHFLLELRARLGAAVYNLARDALSDLANTELETAIVTAFLEKVEESSDKTQPVSSPDAVPSTLENDDVIIVRSAFDLSPDQKKQIRQALTEASIHKESRESTDSNSSIAFIKSPDLICGIEAQFNHRRLAWNLGEYLDSYAGMLDATLVAQLDTRGKRPWSDDQDAAPGEILPA